MKNRGSRNFFHEKRGYVASGVYGCLIIAREGVLSQVALLFIHEGMEKVAKALGLDPSASQAEIIKQANALKKCKQTLERVLDYRHLLEDKVATDCTIQVNIPLSEDGSPQAKRARTNGGSNKAATLVTTKTIKAHTLVLSKQSEYFKAMIMKDKGADSQNKMLWIEIGSEKEFEAFKLLMELSYSGIYTKQGGDETTFCDVTLVALIIVANMFEFTYCIEQCCDEIGHGLTSNNALDFVDCLAPLDPLREPIKELLDKAIDCLGPLERLWTQGPFYDSGSSAIQNAGILRLELTTSIDALIYLLKSDKLQMESENTTFTLVHWWFKNRQEGWTQEQKQEAFNKIMDSNALRFHYMDPIYLAAYAMRTPWMQDSTHHMDSILQQSLMVQEGSEATMELAKNRGRNQGGTYQLEGEISKQECARLNVGEGLCSFIGVAAGLPVYLYVGRKEYATDTSKSTLQLSIGWSSGGLPWAKTAGGKIRPAVSMAIWIEARPGNQRRKVDRRPVHDDQNWGYSDFFGCSWKVTMGDGSPFFDPQGDMKVHATISLAK